MLYQIFKIEFSADIKKKFLAKTLGDDDCAVIRSCENNVAQKRKITVNVPMTFGFSILMYVPY